MSPFPPAAADPHDQPAPTRLWLRVAGAEEAALAAVAGFDGVEASPEAARSIRSAYAGPLRLRLELPSAEDFLAETLTAEADELCVPADALPARGTTGRPTRIVARLGITEATPERVASLAGRADAVTVEAAEGERLFAVADIAGLDGCARACRAAGLAFGVAGNLEAPDVARLLLLAPDHLGFDRAARHGHGAAAPLDPQALLMLRGLVPRREPAAIKDGGALDRLFVRDLVLLLSIGAYRAERDAKQRVRFTVEAEVTRPATPPRDMRDIVSYDIIVETIRMLAARPHVAFVETLAEEIAATLLAQPRLVAVTVTVEKLDVVKGSIGIRIERRRA